jgi:rhamnulokinase
VHLPDGIHWNLLNLFNESLSGLAAAAAQHRLAGVGVDAWGVDYALLDDQNRVLGLPFHYRDERTSGMVERAHRRVPREELYAVTGIQTLPINTIYQLLGDEGSAALDVASGIALVPDLFNLWFTGVLANESTVASTTGLLEAATGRWARDLIRRVELPAAPFSGEPVEPGFALGRVISQHAIGAELPVYAVASHDTASAFAAAPVTSANTAILSSGTWSLLGLELDRPVLTADAASYNLTNERGVDGSIRLLSNVMGLWLLQECRRCWEAMGMAFEYDELQRLAAAAGSDVPVFDPDDEDFLAPGDMPGRIADACVRTGQPAPAHPGATVRAILLSLACKYRLVLARLERVTGRKVDAIHVIGGGSQNALLCQLTADVTGRPVLAGPVEATALGNVLVQARARGELGSRAEMRELAAASAAVLAYEPKAASDGADAFERFVLTTGQGVEISAPAAA